MPRAKKHKTWRDEDMQAAVATFKAGGISFRNAASQFNVPKSSLRDRVTGRVIHGKKNGAETKLTPADEEKLAAYLIETSKQGYGKSKEIILFMATQIALKRGKTISGGCLSDMWWKGFLKRHPEISLRAAQNFGVVRTLVTRPVIEAFYQRLLDTLTNNGIGSLLEKPHLIFNADESGFEFDAINKIVAAAKGSRHIPRISKGQHEKVTVLASASAAGNSIPPMFIFKSQSGRVPNGVQEGAPAGTLFMAQKSGWIEKDLYLKWFKEVFLRSVPAERPILLLVDGHKAHVTMDVIEEAVANKILIFCLPAHASHLLQPLDLSLFGPLKKGWVKACAAFHHLTSVVVNQRNFSKVFNIAWHSSNTPDVIRAGFRRSGIYPFNPQAFDYTRLAPSKPSTPRTTSFTTLSIPSIHGTALPVPSVHSTSSFTALPVPSAQGTAAFTALPVPSVHGTTSFTALPSAHGTTPFRALSVPSAHGTTSFTALPVPSAHGTTSSIVLPVPPVSPGPSSPFSPLLIPSTEEPFHSVQETDAVMPADPWPSTENPPLPWVSAAITPAPSLSERLVSMEYQLGKEQ